MCHPGSDVHYIRYLDDTFRDKAFQSHDHSTGSDHTCPVYRINNFSAFQSWLDEDSVASEHFVASVPRSIQYPYNYTITKGVPGPYYVHVFFGIPILV